MVAQSKILIIDDDEAARESLRVCLSEYPHYQDICQICSLEESENEEAVSSFRIILQDQKNMRSIPNALCFVKPVRVGAVLDSIERAARRSQNEAHVQSIAFGGWVLDTLYNTLSNEKKKTSASIRLTEKEKDILVFLHEHTGQSVSREVLLQNIWAYAEGVETHTLETHIYRLRQKIEVDPAAPQILLTTETGYQLAS